MPVQKIEKFTGVTKIAPAAIESHETEQALRMAQYELDMMLLDLKNESFSASPSSVDLSLIG